jgi:hypothetical protein
MVKHALDVEALVTVMNHRNQPQLVSTDVKYVQRTDLIGCRKQLFQPQNPSDGCV